MSAAYQVVVNRDLLAQIGNYNTDDAAKFLMKKRINGLLSRGLSIGEKDARAAVLTGNLQVIALVKTDNLIDIAAECGMLEVVKWLGHRGNRSTKWAMNYAAENGHLEVIKWLHENRNENPGYVKTMVLNLMYYFSCVVDQVLKKLIFYIPHITNGLLGAIQPGFITTDCKLSH